MNKLKWYKKVGIVFISLISIVITFCGVVILNGTCFKSYKDTNTSISWMKDLNDETLLTSVKLPGSHDACTYNMLWLGECQNLDIKEQLNIGVRYFDIRVKNDNDKYIIYHGPINGVEFDPIIDSIREFIKVNTSETLILDFQHFENDSQDYVFKKIKEKLLPYLIFNNDTNISDQEFVSNLKIKDTRGKCLILFGYGCYEDEAFIFRRNNDDCSNPNCSLDSFYYTERNIVSSKDYINNEIPFYINKIKEKHNKEEYKALSVLQCQLTDGKLIFGPYSREKVHNKNMSKYINETLSTIEDFDEINIIMRDFMDETKTKEIYELNFIDKMWVR